MRTLVLMLTAHNRMLDDLERGVDNTDDKLARSMKTLQKFIKDTEGEMLRYSCMALSS